MGRAISWLCALLLLGLVVFLLWKLKDYVT